VRELLTIYDSPFVCTTYQNLTERTNETLSEISKYLALDEELTPIYETMWATGEPGIGDPSETIKEGRVRRKKETSYDVNLDPETLGRAQDRYRRFCSFCDGRAH
jgi:hypothetical protein